jgi:hypothetical protein
MPYLLKQDKDNIDNQGGIDIYEKFASMTPQEVAGAINYLNFKIIKTWITKNGKKYWVFALFTGTLICCILEVYRRLVAPYEDEKIQSSGDVD